ncbi:acyl carrier protein [Nocardia brevicatena]|uniref:acyl carrier protein n=1 Tax=Nocardia brevicatena TaxID=37327 RepID=UPI0012FCD00B|nr:acyl carrier protein [Nocardia brevicatena]
MEFGPVDKQLLRRLPRWERDVVLEDLVTQIFKGLLFMEKSDELPFDENYFDMGLTSLQLTEAKEKIELTLECEIETTHLFNNPTIAHLVEHLNEIIVGTG